MTDAARRPRPEDGRCVVCEHRWDRHGEDGCTQRYNERFMCSCWKRRIWLREPEGAAGAGES